MQQSSAANIALISSAALLLVWRFKRLRGTTLTGPWSWAMVCLLGFLAAELTLARLDSVQQVVHSSAIRFAAACGSFCPLMSLLGAKRPQDRGWHFVVISLWAILALPTFETFFLHRGRSLEIHWARGWFLWALIVVAVINMLPTRFWLSTLVFTGSQVILLAEKLPLIPWWKAVPNETIAFSGIVLAIFLASIRVARRPDVHPYSRLWLDFRDSFGTLWSLRFAERMNSAARLNDWPITLDWRGFRTHGNRNALQEFPPELEPAIQKTLVNLLRRFVSNDWITQRLGKPLLD